MQLENGVGDSRSEVAQKSALVVNEAQLILAEKRTAFSALRTGIAIFALPLSVLSVLIVTSRYYDIYHVLPLLIPVVLINLGLVCLAIYLVVHSFQTIHHYDRVLAELKAHHRRLAELLD